MVALPQPTTAGMPSSRATMAAWDSGAPTSVTTAAARGKIGVQPTLVTAVTSTSPGCSRCPCSAVERTRAVPSTTPAEPGKPRHRVGGRGARAGQIEVGAPVRVGGPPERVEPPADQRRVARQGPVALVDRAPVLDGGAVRLGAVQHRGDLVRVEEEHVVPQAGELTGPEHVGPQHPEVADHLAAACSRSRAIVAQRAICQCSSLACSGWSYSRVRQALSRARSCRSSSSGYPTPPAGLAANCRSIQSGSSAGLGVEISNSCGLRWPKVRLKVSRSISPGRELLQPVEQAETGQLTGFGPETGGDRHSPSRPRPGSAAGVSW